MNKKGGDLTVGSKKMGRLEEGLEEGLLARSGGRHPSAFRNWHISGIPTVRELELVGKRLFGDLIRHDLKGSASQPN
jgi:hypothetical protein